MPPQSPEFDVGDVSCRNAFIQTVAWHERRERNAFLVAGRLTIVQA